MEHFKKFVKSMGFTELKDLGSLDLNKLSKEEINDLFFKFKKMSMSFSNRIDLLENFISNNTEHDGKKVGFNSIKEVVNETK